MKEKPEDWEFTGESLDDLIKRKKTEFAAALFKEVADILVARYFPIGIARAKEYEFEVDDPMIMYAWGSPTRKGVPKNVEIKGEVKEIMLEIFDMLDGRSEL